MGTNKRPYSNCPAHFPFPPHQPACFPIPMGSRANSVIFPFHQLSHFPSCFPVPIPQLRYFRMALDRAPTSFLVRFLGPMRLTV